MRTVALLLTLSLALAGCIGNKDPAEDEAIGTQSADDAEGTGATTPSTSAPTSSTKPSSRPGGPSPPTPATPPTPGTPASAPGGSSNASAPSTVVVEGDAGAALIVSAPEVGPSGLMVGFAVLDLPQASPRAGTLVATWESATPLDATMDIELYDLDGNTIATASGASPLAVEIPGEAFGTAVELRGSAFPTAPGASVEYTVHFALTALYA